jgi:predicted nucleotidyltransferase
MPGVEGEALIVLAGTTAPLTGRQVSRLARRGSSPAMSAALDRLVEQGLVHRERAGRAYLHSLNRAHVAAPAVELLADLRSELLRRLRGVLRAVRPRPLHASMFGSAARGDGDTQSDIDLFIVRRAGVSEDDLGWRKQLDDLREAVYAWSGNHAAIIELGEEELGTLRIKRPRVLADLRADGIDLSGIPIRALLRERQ